MTDVYIYIYIYEWFVLHVYAFQRNMILKNHGLIFASRNIYKPIGPPSCPIKFT